MNTFGIVPYRVIIMHNILTAPENYVMIYKALRTV